MTKLQLTDIQGFIDFIKGEIHYAIGKCEVRTAADDEGDRYIIIQSDILASFGFAFHEIFVACGVYDLNYFFDIRDGKPCLIIPID